MSYLFTQSFVYNLYDHPGALICFTFVIHEQFVFWHITYHYICVLISRLVASFN